MQNNIEKILTMLSMESIKVRELATNAFNPESKATGDEKLTALQNLEYLYVEIQRFIKSEYKKLEEARDDLYIQALNGRDEGMINNYIVSYKSSARFALDSIKLKEYFEKELGIKEDEMKNLVYSHSETKPSLKFKAVK